MKFCKLGYAYKIRVSQGLNKSESLFTVKVIDEDETHVKGHDKFGILRVIAKSSILSINETRWGDENENTM
jgi:hypothetical protein